MAIAEAKISDKPTLIEAMYITQDEAVELLNNKVCFSFEREKFGLTVEVTNYDSINYEMLMNTVTKFLMNGEDNARN